VECHFLGVILKNSPSAAAGNCDANVLEALSQKRSLFWSSQLASELRPKRNQTRMTIVQSTYSRRAAIDLRAPYGT
jgi:hypothetical protein